MEIPKDILRWLVWAIKIPIKLAYQAVALNANEHPYDFGLSFVFSNWPEGSTFKHPKDYRGLRIAEVTPGVDQILVVNDYLDTNGIRLRKPRFIPLLNSRRLGLYERDKSQGVIDILDVELQSSDEREMTKLKRLGELPQVDISALQQLDGSVVVVDGVHRLMAAFARDQSLISVRFFITL